MSDYFFSLGKILASEIAKNPATRAAADALLSRHLGGGMARDALPGSLRRNYGRDQDPEMPPRGREDGNGNGNGQQLDPSECLSAIEMMLRSLSGPDRAALVGALHELLTSEPGNGGGNGYDDERHPADPVHGTMIPNGGAAPLDRQRAAQDSAQRARNSQSFNQRWGKQLAHIDSSWR